MFLKYLLCFCIINKFIQINNTMSDQQSQYISHEQPPQFEQIEQQTEQMQLKIRQHLKIIRKQKQQIQLDKLQYLWRQKDSTQNASDTKSAHKTKALKKQIDCLFDQKQFDGHKLWEEIRKDIQGCSRKQKCIRSHPSQNAPNKVQSKKSIQLNIVPLSHITLIPVSEDTPSKQQNIQLQQKKVNNVTKINLSLIQTPTVSLTPVQQPGVSQLQKIDPQIQKCEKYTQTIYNISTVDQQCQIEIQLPSPITIPQKTRSQIVGIQCQTDKKQYYQVQCQTHCASIHTTHLIEHAKHQYQQKQNNYLKRINILQEICLQNMEKIDKLQKQNAKYRQQNTQVSDALKQCEILLKSYHNQSFYLQTNKQVLHQTKTDEDQDKYDNDSYNFSIQNCRETKLIEYIHFLQEQLNQQSDIFQKQIEQLDSKNSILIQQSQKILYDHLSIIKNYQDRLKVSISSKQHRKVILSLKNMLIQLKIEHQTALKQIQRALKEDLTCFIEEHTASLNELLQILSEKLQKKEKQCSEIEIQNIQLIEQKSLINQQFIKITQSLKQYKQKVDANNEEAIEMLHKNELLQKQLSQTKQQKNKLQSLLRKMVQEASQISSQNKKRRDQLQNRNRILSENILQLQKQINILKKRQQNLHNKCREIQEKFVLENYDKQQKQDEINQLKQKIRLLEQKSSQNNKHHLQISSQISPYNIENLLGSPKQIQLKSSEQQLSNQKKILCKSQKKYNQTDNNEKAKSVQALPNINIDVDDHQQQQNSLRKAKSYEESQPQNYSPIPVKINWNQSHDNKFMAIEELSEQNRQTVKIQEPVNNQSIKSQNIHNANEDKIEISLKNYASSVQQKNNKTQQFIQTQNENLNQHQQSSKKQVPVKKLKLEKVLSIEYDRSAGDLIEVAQQSERNFHQQIPKQNLIYQKSQKPLNKTIPHITTPVKSIVMDYQPQFAHKSQSFDKNVINISEQNNKLIDENNKLKQQKKQLQQSLLKITNKWKKLKDQQNDLNDQKLVQASELKENINIIIKNKEKMFKQFDHNDFQTLCQQMDKLIKETNRWIDMLTSLTHQNKKRALNQSKIVKKRTIKINRGLSRQKSIYSEGNSPAKKLIDFDISPFQGEFHEHHDHHQINTLQKLFNQDRDISEISSVKQYSQNSSFLNSKSQIANILGKQGNLFKKDIVDEIVTSQAQKQRSRPPTAKQQNKTPKYNLPQNGLTKNFQQKSNKSKKKLINRTLIKMSIIQKKLEQNKKQYSQLLSKIISGYQAKIKKMQKQFQKTLNLIINSPKTQNMLIANDINSTVNSEQNSERIKGKNDKEQLMEKKEELEKMLENQVRENQKKQKIIATKNQVISQLQKKMKEEKASCEKVALNYNSQVVYSNTLKKTILQLQKDFASFMEKITQSHIMTKNKQEQSFHNQDKVKVQVEKTINVPQKVDQQVQTQIPKQQNSMKQMKLQKIPKQQIQMVYNYIDSALSPNLSDSRISQRSQGKMPLSVHRKRSFSEASQLQKKSIYQNIKDQVDKLSQQFDFPNIYQQKTADKSDRNNIVLLLGQIHQALRKQRTNTNDRINYIKKRCLEIMKLFIIKFKISQKTLDKVLKQKQAQDSSQKFMELRRDLQSYYEQQKVQESQTFESFEEKMDYLRRQLDLKNLQLSEKQEEIRQNKEVINQYTTLKRNISQESLNKSNTDDEVFYEFEEKSQFSNLKPLKDEIRELRQDLQFYKRKYQEHQREKKKKTQVFYVRR